VGAPGQDRAIERAADDRSMSGAMCTAARPGSGDPRTSGPILTPSRRLGSNFFPSFPWRSKPWSGAEFSVFLLPQAPLCLHVCGHAHMSSTRCCRPAQTARISASPWLVLWVRWVSSLPNWHRGIFRGLPTAWENILPKDYHTRGECGHKCRCSHVLCQPRLCGSRGEGCSLFFTSHLSPCVFWKRYPSHA